VVLSVSLSFVGCYDFVSAKYPLSAVDVLGSSPENVSSNRVTIEGHSGSCNDAEL